MYTRPLWDWALDLLADPLLALYFVWNAQCLYKHNGTCYERFIDEPWMADHWWRIQVCSYSLSYCIETQMCHSLHYLPRMESLLCSFCMLTRHNYHRLALWKLTGWAEEWKKYWWWAFSWVAANCKFHNHRLVLRLKIPLIIGFGVLGPWRLRGRWKIIICQPQTCHLARIIPQVAGDHFSPLNDRVFTQMLQQFFTTSMYILSS